MGRKVSNGPQEVREYVRTEFRLKPLTLVGPQIEMLDWMSRTALELIGQSGLGHSFDPLTEDAETNYYTRGVREYK